MLFFFSVPFLRYMYKYIYIHLLSNYKGHTRGLLWTLLAVDGKDFASSLLFLSSIFCIILLVGL